MYLVCRPYIPFSPYFCRLNGDKFCQNLYIPTKQASDFCPPLLQMLLRHFYRELNGLKFKKSPFCSTHFLPFYFLRLVHNGSPTCKPCMRFLSIRPDFCRRLPSDSALQRTPLPLAICFPSLGRIGDFHPLEHAHAGRTKKEDASLKWCILFSFLIADYKFFNHFFPGLVYAHAINKIKGIPIPA